MHNERAEAWTMIFISLTLCWYGIVRIVGWLAKCLPMLAACLLFASCKGVSVPNLGDIASSVTNAPTGQIEPATGTSSETVPDEQSEGFACSIPVTHQISLKSVTSSMVYFSNPGLDWPEKGDCCGEARIAWKLNGQWTTPKKFDHIRRGTTSRDFKNIEGGYAGIVEPAVGTRTAMILVSYDGKRRTNAIFWDWK